MTENDKANIQSILYGEGDWFTARLVRLIAKADHQNRTKIHKAFPEEVEAVHLHLTGQAFEPAILETS